MQTPLTPDFYYLANFHKVLAWLGERYDDLLDADERTFLHQLPALPLPAQALLVRMIMRKGVHFRASKLSYGEIGCPHQAAQPLLETGWITDRAQLPLSDLFPVLRKGEILTSFAAHAPRPQLRKHELLEQLDALFDETRSFADWCPDLPDTLYSVTIDALCERLRLMFFGNLRQDWSEFVLADLGIFRYEQVALGPDSRAFRQRADVDHYLHLQRCRERFEAGEPIIDVLDAIGPPISDNPYLTGRRDKLLFRIGQHLEREGEADTALAVYRASAHPGARQRQVRILERQARHADAHALAQEALAAPFNDAEAQLLQRALLRLNRQLGLPAPAKNRSTAPRRLDLNLPRPSGLSVEHCVRLHLGEPEAPVHYVENTLICGLFGLLCWEAIFAPLPGAFFHPFHSAPADLLAADFALRRTPLFNEALNLLDTPHYPQRIRQTYQDKFGIQSPFVHWGVLDETLLDQALACLPAAHLKAWFTRLLGDIQANRAGMPDLIQFWPAQQRYRMIEVKGPGDRLQDNQRRWLAFCAEHGMPVDVCYVQWSDASDAVQTDTALSA